MNKILKLREFLNLDFAVSWSEGDKVYKYLTEILDEADEIIVDFMNIEITTTVFLNAAFGQLYRDYSISQMEIIKMINIKPTQQQLLEKVIKTAQHYHNDSESFNINAKKHF